MDGVATDRTVTDKHLGLIGLVDNLDHLPTIGTLYILTGQHGQSQLQALASIGELEPIGSPYDDSESLLRFFAKRAET